MTAPSYKAWVEATLQFVARSGNHFYYYNLLRGCHSISSHCVSSRKVGSSIENRITDRGAESGERCNPC